MAYDFNKNIDRKNIYACKWDCSDNELPMWLADMDLETAPCILEALKKRVNNGTFGYTDIPDAWYQAIIDWYQRRHHVILDKTHIGYSTGVVAIISSAVRRFTQPGDSVIVLSPGYNIFHNSIINNGCHVLECGLIQQEDYTYRINWTQFEEFCALEQTKMFILCNPHNPTGHFWTKDELLKIKSITHKYHVFVLSDEVHCELTVHPEQYIPYITIDADSVSCISISKAFNCAGLQTAAFLSYNSDIRYKVWRGVNTDEVGEQNAFAIQATLAAYNDGEDWLNNLNEFIEQHKKYVAFYIFHHLKDLKVTPSEATYLMWIDGSSLGIPHLASRIRSINGLYLADGETYGIGGEGMLRINVACTDEQLIEGMHRLNEAINILLKGE